MRLIPREEKFFDDFNALAKEVQVGANLLVKMFGADPIYWDAADEIKEVEHRCDSLTHELLKRLHRTFVTPFDREDIHALAMSLDDVMDAIDAAAEVTRRYRVDTARYGSREMVRIIHDSTKQLVTALEALGRHTAVMDSVVEVNRLENEADRVHNQSLTELFDTERDPIAIMKWKEILEFLEEATDRCEDVANVVEGVVLKHA